MFKLIGLLVCVALAQAIELQHAYHAPVYASPIVKHIAPLVKHVEVEAPAHYDFSYSVHDHHTGDIKSQQESRKDDVVHGQYSLVDADGYLRVVDYTSDAHNGFNAVVRREPLGHKVVKAVAPVAKVYAPAPILAHAPLHYAPAPIHYAAPIAKVAVAPAVAHVSVAHPAYAYHH